VRAGPRVRDDGSPPSSAARGLADAPGIALVGALRPLLVVPARRISRREAEHAFLHELAHHRRRDLLVALAATAVRCVFWWHPAAWLAAARVSDLREQCCDADVAAALGADAPAYREMLLQAARRLVDGPPHPRTAEIAWLGSRVGLAARLDVLSRAPVRRSWIHRAGTAATVAVAAACAVPMDAASAPYDDLVASRRLLADVAAGRTRASCFETRYAALRLAAAQASQEGPHR
jgi:beta-lactamase regulating signal transducer with metallopeptidase domain